uniref:Small ribosomal subunit protein mS40 n=1 Tax=Timema bartmani TaxID=61472 RepID=A0A7R9ERR3_9NEOP|nr:unnamed protein product [Timema bartmani]
MNLFTDGCIAGQRPPSSCLTVGTCLAQETAVAETKEGNQTLVSGKDRTKVIPVETSIRYLKSKVPVWVQYRRNHKGAFPPRKTRKTCIRQGAISTGNPCPICRDEYLVLDHRNVELLRQFISPFTGEILSYTKTGVCQKRHQELLVAIQKARDFGFVTFDVPFRVYDYSEYYKPQSDN